MLRIFAAFATVFAMISAAVAQEREVSTLNKVFPYLASFQELDPAKRDRIELAYQFSLAPPLKIADASFWVDDNGSRVPLELDPNGFVSTDFPARFLEQDLTLWTDVPQGKGSVSMTIRPRFAKGASRFSGADIAAALEQANSAIKAQAGLMSFAAPSMKSVWFAPAPGTTYTALDASGRKIELKQEEKSGRVLVSRKNAKKLAALTFSAPPLAYGFVD